MRYNLCIISNVSSYNNSKQGEKSMKRKALLILTGILSLSLVACSSKSESPAASSAVTTSTTAAPKESAAEESQAPSVSGKITFYTYRTDIANTKIKELADAFHLKYP